MARTSKQHQKKYKATKAAPLGAFWKLWTLKPTKRGRRWICVAIGNEQELRDIVEVLNGRR